MAERDASPAMTGELTLRLVPSGSGKERFSAAASAGQERSGGRQRLRRSGSAQLAAGACLRRDVPLASQRGAPERTHQESESTPSLQGESACSRARAAATRDGLVHETA